MSQKRFLLLNTFIFIFIVGIGIGGFYYYHQKANYISTDDAKVSGDIIPIMTEVQGKLTEWKIKNGSQVKKGEVIGKVTTGERTTDILAPDTGTIIQNQINSGQLVTPGQPLAQLVDLNQLYITANIEEQNIQDLQKGQKVDVTIDAIGETKIIGKVQEIGLATNSLFSLFPTTNTEGNYTKTVQRVPVKITLESYPREILPGMNSTVKIHK